MLRLQIVPHSGLDAYRLLRDKVTHEAQTWAWKNKAKTRLTRSSEPKRGYIEVGSADGIVVAKIRPARASDDWFLAEKFIGRLIAWFPSHIVAINLQFHDQSPAPSRKKRRA